MDGERKEVDKWREVAAQKEKEWKEVTELRIQSLESECSLKDKQLFEEKEKFHKLKEDFKYNLKLLGERDQELERYDTTFADLKGQLNAKNAEVSELKIQIDELKTRLSCEDKSREELQIHYQHRLREKQAEIDSFRCTKDGEIQEERKEFEAFKRNLQRKLTEVEEEMDAQKRELTASFEEAMRKREHEFRVQADAMSSKVLEYELKAKLLSKELDLVRAAHEKNNQEFEEVESNHRSLEKKLKEKDWEIQDLRAMKEATISDMENQLKQTEVAMKRMQEEFKRKHAEMDKYGREKETALTKVKEAYASREQSLQNDIRELQSKLEDAQVEIRRLQWANQDLEKEKNLQIEKLHEESHQLKDKWDKQLVDVSRSQVNKDLELQNLREVEEKLKADLLQKKEDIERYKKELSSAVERESVLERSKVQLDLDWQRRFEDLERQQYEKSEELIKKLTRSRDEAMAMVKEKSRDLQQRETLINALQKDREQAFATLKKHGIKVDKNINIEAERLSLATEDVSQLQQQNDSLKAVIHEMRQQMEQLGQNIPVPDKNLQQSRADSITEEYVRSLEKEMRELRQKNRELEQDADVARRFGRHPVQPAVDAQAVMSEVKDNVLVRSHIQSLNDKIGALRAEKVELSAQVKKQQARLQHLETMMDKLSKEPREKQVEIDQLQYELGAQNRRSSAEIASLRQRLAELELQLVEARKEADEYHKGNLERNMEVTALGQELSNMKVELAQKRPPINFGAQELLIQQLQDEIMKLRQQNGDLSSIGPGNSGNPTIDSLQHKLRNAAKKITELAKEKQQLMEISNKLRAELKKAGVDPATTPPRSKPKPRFTPQPPEGSRDGHMTSSQPISQDFLNKLSQLEKLQYELTRQQLQYAQKFPTPRVSNGGERGLSDTEEYRPTSILKKYPTTRDSQDYTDVRVSINTEGGETQASAASLPTNQELLMSMSSMGGESLQEIWKMLEERGSPSPMSARTPRYLRQSGDSDLIPQHPSDTPSNSADLSLMGRRAGIEPRSRPDRAVSDRVLGRVAKKPQQKPKIRNYNYRDESGVR